MSDGRGSDGWQISQAQALGARERQEDVLRTAWLGDRSGGWNLALVCDGMGGHEGGQQAASVAADAFMTALSTEAPPASGKAAVSALKRALSQAVATLADHINHQGAPPGMGTTLTAILLRGGDLAWISVGDSLLLHRRARRLQRLNADHSMVPVLDGLVATGRISRQEAATDPRRSALRSALGGEKPTLCDCQFRPSLLLPGDDLLLASDGLSTLDDPALLAALEQETSAQTLIDQVIAAGRPYQDNASLVLLRASRTGGNWKPHWWHRLLPYRRPASFAKGHGT